MKARQFVNVVMRRYGMGSSHYSVSRIKPEEQLFYPSTMEAQASSTGEMETISRMPAPNLSMVRSAVLEERLDFLPFYERGSGGYSKILLRRRPGPHRPIRHRRRPLPLGALPQGSQGAQPRLLLHPGQEAPGPRAGERLVRHGQVPSVLRLLQLRGPHVQRPLQRQERLAVAPAPASANGCHALIHDDGDPTRDPILVVSSADGTHCFHTFTNSWFKAGDWTLPFVGRAERVPELDNLWFGIAAGWPYNLCAMDLYSIAGLCAEAPRLAYSWGDLSLPDDWEMMDCSMVYLGGGRFCVAKIFEFCLGDYRKGMGVISGLEVVRQGEPSKLVMVKHKSKLYKFTSGEIQCIL